MPSQPHVFWLFGLSGAGKTTLASALQTELGAALMLDGDRLRSGLCQGLGFTDADRTENLRRAAEVARLGLESGLVVIAAFITPREEQRALIRQIVGAGRISFIFVDAPLAVCRGRDVKGLYAAAGAGRVPQMTGVSATFEISAASDLHLNTARETAAVSATRLCTYARDRLGASQGLPAALRSRQPKAMSSRAA